MNAVATNSLCSRRRFLSGCACAGCVAGGTLLSSPLIHADERASGRPKVRLVFCETTNDKPIWPNIGYDFDTRRKQVLDALNAAPEDVKAGAVPGLMMLRGIAKPAGVGRFTWVVEMTPEGKVLVNGLDMSAMAGQP